MERLGGVLERSIKRGDSLECGRDEGPIPHQGEVTLEVEQLPRVSLELGAAEEDGISFNEGMPLSLLPFYE